METYAATPTMEDVYGPVITAEVPERELEPEATGEPDVAAEPEPAEANAAFTDAFLSETEARDEAAAVNLEMQAVDVLDTEELAAAFGEGLWWYQEPPAFAEALDAGMETDIN
jgi:hypothetical protein